MVVQIYPYEQLTHDGATVLVRSHRKTTSVRGACFMHAKKKPYRVKVVKLSDQANEEGHLYQLYREDRA